MKSSVRRLVPLLLLLAAAPAKADFLRVISTAEGLSNNSILSLSQDGAGRIWLGTCEGLNIWDGREMDVYAPDNRDGRALSGNLIERIRPDSRGGTWIETDYGLDRVDAGGNLRHYTVFRGIYRMLSWRGERPLVLTQSNHLFQYDPGTDAFVEIPRPEMIRYEAVLASVEAGEALWVFSAEGVLRMVDGQVEVFRSIPLTHASAHPGEAFLIDGNGTLYKMDFGSLHLEYQADFQDQIRHHGVVSSIIRDGDDLVVAFLFDGVTRLAYRAESPQHFRPQRLPVSGGVFALMKDRRQDILWIASDGHGLCMYAKESYDLHSYSYDRLRVPLSTPIRALKMDAEGNLWFATKGEGLFRIDRFRPDAGEPLPVQGFSEGLASPAVFALEQSRHNLLWIGTEGGGINYYSYRDRRIHTLSGALPDDLRYIHAFHESSPDTLWAATVGRGVFRILLSGGDEPRATECTKLDFGALPRDSEFYFCLFPDGDGTLWLGNRGGGLVHYDPRDGSSRNYYVRGEAADVSNDVWAIRRDGKGRLWLGTGSGLVRFEGDGRIVPTPVVGIIHEIREDTRGHLWLSTNNGLVRYNPEGGRTVRYGYAYGLNVLEFSDGASGVDADGNLYFGGTNGFSVIRATPYPGRPFSPPLSIHALRMDGDLTVLTDQPHGKGIIIPPHSHLNAISVLAIDFIDGGNYRYRYQIDGVSNVWTETGADIPMPPLQPGRYTFHVRYYNPDTGYESPILSTPLRVQAPVYATPLAKGLYILLALGLALTALTVFRRSSERKEREQRERMEARRNEEVLASKLNLLRNFARQIERPVSMVAAPCQQILDDPHSGERIRTYAEDALRYCTRIGHTVRLFHEISDREEGVRKEDIQLFSPKDILSELVDTYEEIARSKGLRFRADIPAKLVWVSSPRTLISAVDLLLTNAFFHVQPQRNVSLEITPEEEQLRLLVRMEGEWPDEEAIRAFADRAAVMEYLQQGSGEDYALQDEMRLAVCNNMVSHLGGRMSISREGGESLFRILLPRMEMGEQGRTASPVGYDSIASILLDKGLTHEEGTSPGRRSLFLLGSDAGIMQAVSSVFSDSFRVSLFSGADAFRQQMVQGHPDVVICEMLDDSPEVAGVLRSLKADKSTSKIPLILIAQAPSETLPADSTMSLPLDYKNLKLTVEQHLRRMGDLQDYFTSTVSEYEFCQGKKLHREDKELLERLYRIIRSNLQRPDLTTRMIAEEMGMSLRNLYAKLGGLLTVTPSNIIREYRLAYAGQLLLKTKLTVDEVIWRTGFANRGTFFKNFSAKYGCTPRDYRNNRPEEEDE